MILSPHNHLNHPTSPLAKFGIVKMLFVGMVHKQSLLHFALRLKLL